MDLNELLARATELEGQVAELKAAEAVVPAEPVSAEEVLAAVLEQKIALLEDTVESLQASVVPGVDPVVDAEAGHDAEAAAVIESVLPDGGFGDDDPVGSVPSTPAELRALADRLEAEAEEEEKAFDFDEVDEAELEVKADPADDDELGDPVPVPDPVVETKSDEGYEQLEEIEHLRARRAQLG